MATNTTTFCDILNIHGKRFIVRNTASGRRYHAHRVDDFTLALKHIVPVPKFWDRFVLRWIFNTFVACFKRMPLDFAMNDKIIIEHEESATTSRCEEIT